MKKNFSHNEIIDILYWLNKQPVNHFIDMYYEDEIAAKEFDKLTNIYWNETLNYKSKINFIALNDKDKREVIDIYLKQSYDRVLKMINEKN
jgi:hypothetical protein|tara:strand:- start:330 stop:602 length:273 start_codon:yes stop_codon:yes gene_type:complete